MNPVAAHIPVDPCRAPCILRDMKGTDFILGALAAEGVDHLFLVPGGLVDPFLPAIGRQSAIRPIVAAQEGGAAYMADGYARASGRFGAVLCIGGPGLTNTVTAVATARTDGSPLLVLSGEVATELEGMGFFQDASQETLDDVGILKPLTLHSTSVDAAANLPHVFQKALLRMLARPRGPVHLSLPRGTQLGDIDVAHRAVDRSLASPVVLARADAEASLSRLLGEGGAQRTRVAILAGAGVEHANASGLLREVAERWKIPVATTLRAKGVFPEDHPLSLGVFGYAGTHHARRALLDEPPDLLLVLGSGLNERDSMQWTLHPRSMIAVDLDPAVLGVHDPDGGVVGDCGAYLAFLLEAGPRIDAAMARTLPDRAAWLEGVRAIPRLQAPGDTASDRVPLHPARVVAELRRALPRDAILLVDSGAHRAFTGHYWSAYEPRTYVSATNLGPMGWAIPAAVGVQCARPDRKVAVVTGDGCMHMHGIEVATAARYGLPIVFVVLDNSALGNVWLRAHAEGPVPDALTRLPDLDWAGFGRSLGCAGETVRRPGELAPAFARALAAAGPTVIDVKVEVACPTPVADWSAAVASWSYHE